MDPDLPKILLIGLIEQSSIKTIIHEIPGIKECFTVNDSLKGVEASSSLIPIISPQPYLLIRFLPMDQMLISSFYDGSWQDNCAGYDDAQERMHNRSSLELILCEDDMEWVMSMMFHCQRVVVELLLLPFIIAGAAFGSVHCAAWNFEFTSHTEQIMWRTASLTLVGVCLSVLIAVPLWDLGWKLFQRSSPGSLTERICRNFVYFEKLKMISVIPTIIYLVARLTLLILALLSLRDLHGPALQTVAWTTYIPHI